jgi:oxalyl-CoA decarboxylase
VRGIIDMHQPRKRSMSAPGASWGSAWVIPCRGYRDRQARLPSKATAPSGLGHGSETICRYGLPVCVVIFNNDGIYRGTDVNTSGTDPHDRLRQRRATTR